MNPRRIALAYAMWLLPALLGAVLDWSRWLILALLVPGLIWYGATQGLSCYRQMRTLKPNSPSGLRIPALYSSSLFVGAIVFFPGRLVGVFIVAGFILADLGWWWQIRASMPKTRAPAT